MIFDFSSIFQPIFILLFSWSLVTICGALLLIQMEIVKFLIDLLATVVVNKTQSFHCFYLLFQSHHDTELFVLFVLGFEVFYAFLWVFISCELGERFSNEFDGINNVVDRLNWHEFPIEVQRMLPFIIAIAQRPVALVVFGTALCQRDTFGSVSQNKSILLVKYTHIN